MNALCKNLAVEKTNYCHNVSIKEGCSKDLILLLLSGKVSLGISVLVKIDLTLLFLRIIGYYRSFLSKEVYFIRLTV